MEKRTIAVTTRQTIITTTHIAHTRDLEIGGTYWTNGAYDMYDYDKKCKFRANKKVYLADYIPNVGFLVVDDDNLLRYHEGEDLTKHGLRFVRTLWYDEDRKELAGSFGPRSETLTTIKTTVDKK